MVSKSPRYWMLGLAGLSILVAYLLLFDWLSTLHSCPKRPYGLEIESSAGVISYEDLLSRYGEEPVSFHSGRIFLVLMLVAPILVLFSEKGHIQAAFLLLVVVACGIVACGYYFAQIFVFSVNCSYTTLQDVQSVEVDDHRYHLTFAYDFVGELGISEWTIYIFECDPTSEACTGHFIPPHGSSEQQFITYYDDSKRPNAHLAVDQDAHQVRVYVDDHIIFSINSNTMQDKP